ncbi:MAG: hypothetical protein K0Q99_883 [Clostridia bacterium]|jgi:hypothetical protein|nr:hypothetical protein [Clostridia bacterium]
MLYFLCQIIDFACYFLVKALVNTHYFNYNIFQNNMIYLTQLEHVLLVIIFLIFSFMQLEGNSKLMLNS